MSCLDQLFTPAIGRTCIFIMRSNTSWMVWKPDYCSFPLDLFVFRKSKPVSYSELPEQKNANGQSLLVAQRESCAVKRELCRLDPIFGADEGLMLHFEPRFPHLSIHSGVGCIRLSRTRRLTSGLGYLACPIESSPFTLRIFTSARFLLRLESLLP